MPDAFDRELALIIDEIKSPKKRSAALAQFAREQIKDVQSSNEAATGGKMRPPRITVDGAKGRPLTAVKPDGTIVAEFNAETDAVRWVLRELQLISPEKSGAYQRSHVVFADGAEVIMANSQIELPDASEFVIASDLSYAKKLDPKDGLPARSKQAPKGVYAAISAVARRSFADEASIQFTFRDIPLRGGGNSRNPAIIVRPL